MSRPDERVDEGLIHAWLDGELDAAEAARVERLVADDAEWAAAAAEARGLIAASSRILGALDVVAGDVIPRGGSAAGTAAPSFGESRVPRPLVAPRRAVPSWMRIAAGFVLVAGVAYLGRSGAELSEPTVAREVVGKVAGDVAGVAAKQAEADAAESEDEVVAAPAPAPATPKRAAPTAPPAGNAAAVAPAATSPVAAMLPAPPPTAEVERGVAGGVATGVATGIAGGRASALVARSTEESKAAATSMQRAAAAQRSAQSERTLDVRNEPAAMMADRTSLIASMSPTLSGCWRAMTTARVDSIQTAPRIVREAGDTLVLALMPPGVEAQVVRESPELLRGTVRDASGLRAALRAERIACTP